MTHGALVGRPRKCSREDLYEQCSFHIAETMPSSVKVGVRPIRATNRRYSSGFRPCSIASASSTLGSETLNLRVTFKDVEIRARLSRRRRRSQAFVLAPGRSLAQSLV